MTGFETIDVEQGAELAKRPEVFVLDARTPGEYDEGHLENATLIPHVDVQTRANELPADKSKPILVYCRSGKRSVAACQVLAGLGYKKLYNLDGGIMAWLDAGKPVVE